MTIVIPAWLILVLKIVVGIGVLFLCACGVMFILLMNKIKLPW